MAIPNWIVSIESKVLREQALSLWADFQRERARALLDYQRVLDEAEARYDSAIKGALDKRHRANQKAKDEYDRAKKSLLQEQKEPAA